MKRCLAYGHIFESPLWRCPECGHTPSLVDGYLAFAPSVARANEGFAPEFFPHLASLEEGHFWFESRNRLVLWALRCYFPDAKDFLEIGCGTGFVLSAVRRSFPRLRLCGGEVFTEALRFAAGRLPGTELYQMDARSIPFDSEFDVVGAFDVLEHIEEDEAVLGEIRRTLRPGGGLLFTVPQHPCLWSVADEHAFHKRRYTRPEALRKVRGAGFEVLRATSFVSLWMPLMLMARLGRNRGVKDFDPHAELRIRPALNRVLGKGLQLERFLIRQGLSFPAGGSLLVIARRTR